MGCGLAAACSARSKRVVLSSLSTASMPAAMFGNMDAMDPKNFGFSVNSDFSVVGGKGTGTEAERGDDVCCRLVLEPGD